MGRTPRLGFHSVASSLVVFMKRLVRGGRGWVWMGRTPRLGFHSVASSLVVFMKGW